MYSRDKDLNKLVKEYVAMGWSVVCGGSHRIAISPNGRKLPIPGSPNPRSVVMWRAQARRLMAA